MKTASIILLSIVMFAFVFGCGIALVNTQIRNAKLASFIEKSGLKSLESPSYYLVAEPIDSPRPKKGT